MLRLTEDFWEHFGSGDPQNVLESNRNRTPKEIMAAYSLRFGDLQTDIRRKLERRMKEAHRARTED
jgi:hypothetical protein